MRHAVRGWRSVLGSVAVVLVFAAAPAARGAGAPQLLGQWHLDELTASSPHTTPDSSGHGLTATSTDTHVDPTTVPGRFADAFEFSGPAVGPTPQLSVPRTAGLEPQHVTLMAWVKHVANSDTGPIWIAGKGAVCIGKTLGASWELHATPQGNISFLVYDGSNIHDSPATSTVPFDGNWHAVAGTFDGTTVRMYLDGRQVGNGTPYAGAIAYGLDDNAFKIGEKWTVEQGDTCSRGDGWAGAIDEVRVYDQALAPAQVAYLQDPGHSTPPVLPPPPPPTPTVTELSQLPTHVQGGPLVIAGTVSGFFTSLQWKIAGHVFVSGPGQNAIRINQPTGPMTVTLRALGLGGAGPAKTLVIHPALPATALGKKIIAKLRPAGGVVGLGSQRVLDVLGRLTGPGRCVSLHTQSDGLDIQGCIQPLNSLQDIPKNELGIVQEQAQALGIPLTRDAAQTALSLSNAYIAYAGVTVNGLRIDPGAGSAVVILPQVHVIAASNAALSIGKLRLGAPPRFSLDTRLVGNSINIGSFGLASGSLDTLGAFRIVGNVDVKLVPPGSGPDSPGARITTTLRAPSFLSVAGVNLQGQVVAHATTEQGLILDKMRIGPINADLGALTIKDFRIDYNSAADEWDGQGEACVPGGGCLNMILNEGGVVIKNGDLQQAGATLDFKPPLVLYPGLDMNNIGFKVGLDPTRINGHTDLTALSFYDIVGNVVMAFPSTAAPFVFDQSFVGPGYPQGFYGRKYTRTTLGIAANASLKVPVLGDIPLGGAYLIYEYPGYVAFGGGVSQNFFDVISMSGGVSGEADFSGPRFNVAGGVDACLIGVICRGAFGVVSSRGAGACLDLGIVHVGGGATFHPFNVTIWPLDGCRWSRFAERNINTNPAADGRLAAASVVDRVLIKRGEPSRAIRLQGTAGAPRVRVSGPGGETLNSSAGSGLTIRDSLRIIRQESTRLTVIGLQNPRPGSYTITLLPGSPAAATLGEAADQAAARLRASVSGRGARRILQYDIGSRRNQRVTFIEVDGRTRRVIGAVNGGGSGRIAWKPAPGSTRRTILAQFELAGLPAERLTATKFSPPAPTLARPHRLRVNRHGRTINASWRAVPGATGYQLIIDTSGAGQHRMTTRHHGARIKRIPRTSSGHVYVRAIGYLRNGPPAGAAFGAVAHGTSALGHLPKPRHLR